MNTNTHPMTDVAFFARAIPTGTASRGSNFAPRVRNHVTTVRKNLTVFEKAEGAGEAWVKQS